MEGSKLHWFGLAAWCALVAAGIVACAGAGAEVADPPGHGAAPAPAAAPSR